MTAVQSYFDALALVKKHKMWSLVLISGLLYLVLITAGLYGIFEGMNAVSERILNISWLKDFTAKYSYLKWVIKILLIGIDIAVFFVYFSLFKYILLTIASPIYAYISERTAEILTGQSYPFSINQLIKDIVRGIRLSVRNIFKQTMLTLLLLVLSFIPILGIFTAILIFIIDAYYYGFAMLDYNCERKKMNYQQSLIFVKAHRGLAIGNGIVFYLLFLIPVLGIIIGAPLSAIAATISLHKQNKL
jgi:CysZ protein